MFLKGIKQKLILAFSQPLHAVVFLADFQKPAGANCIARRKCLLTVKEFKEGEMSLMSSVIR